jgi:saccharopine dehydrogenase-like NADP-dependent oxidoreductase
LKNQQASIVLNLSLLSMKNILIIGAGRSATSLIDYLMKYTSSIGWNITVGDVSEELVKSKTIGYSHARGIIFDINNSEQRIREITNADIVISMLPATMHMSVAKDCVEYKKHLITASYISPEMKALHFEAESKGILLLNECGLDPGIDHMSAMKIIDELKDKNAKLNSFRSYCGGLVAPKYDTNPWGYKFSWNPRNVVLAGQGTARYIENGKLKFLPYHRLFAESTQIEVQGHGKFDAYANRDSISYREPYGIEKINEIIRGTLRMPGYCEAWNIFIQLGLTDDSYLFPAEKGMTFNDLLASFLPGNDHLETRLLNFIPEKKKEIVDKIKWLGFFENIPLPEGHRSPAALLQYLLEITWKLEPGDCDRIVMQHEFHYQLNNNNFIKYSSLIVDGDNDKFTAMAKTVGLPMAISCKLIIENKIHLKGVQIPVKKEIYEPVLKELESLGIKFNEYEKTI